MRLVCISDTHGKSPKSMPDGDILIHAGDWSGNGAVWELVHFCEQLTEWKKQYKTVITTSGNHDWIAENSPALVKEMIEDTGAIYLNDSGCEIDGIKYWASAITPFFFAWAFNRERGEEIKRHWDMIPSDTDVLITHGPVKGIGDLVKMRGSPNRGENVGCQDLRDTIFTRLNKLKLHVCGHIHEGYGIYFEGGKYFVNASILDEKYRLVNDPVVIEPYK